MPTLITAYPHTADELKIQRNILQTLYPDKIIHQTQAPHQNQLYYIPPRYYLAIEITRQEITELQKRCGRLYIGQKPDNAAIRTPDMLLIAEPTTPPPQTIDPNELHDQDQFGHSSWLFSIHPYAVTNCRTSKS